MCRITDLVLSILAIMQQKSRKQFILQMADEPGVNIG